MVRGPQETLSEIIREIYVYRVKLEEKVKKVVREILRKVMWNN